jgi:hypothetical protein
MNSSNIHQTLRVLFSEAAGESCACASCPIDRLSQIFHFPIEMKTLLLDEFGYGPRWTDLSTEQAVPGFNQIEEGKEAK